MKQFEELQELWRKGTVGPERFELLMADINRKKRSLGTKYLLHLLGFAFGILLLAYVWIRGPFITWTTYAAMGMLGLCLVYAMLLQLRTYRDLQALSDGVLESPGHYIQILKRMVRRNYQQHTGKFALYGAGIGLSTILFSFELYFIIGAGIFICLLIFLALWFSASYLYFARVYRVSEERKIASLIEDLERISRQMERGD